MTVAGPLAGGLPPNPRALVVIPPYDERESIGRLLRDVCRVADVDVLVVDDSSPDGTARFRVVEVPIVFEERRAGQSKMSWAIVLETLTKVWALRFAPAVAVLCASPEGAGTRR